MNGFIWHTPGLKEIDIKGIMKAAIVKASSGSGEGLCDYDELREPAGGIGGGSEEPNEDWLYCLEIGPLGGCDYGVVCSYSGIPVLSKPNPNESM